MGLHNVIEKVGRFFKPENLAQQTINYTAPPGEILLPTAHNLALLVIDVQKEFCDPAGERGNKETADVAERIRNIVPAFRAANIPTYAIYFSCAPKGPSEIDFYKFTPDPHDQLIAKNKNSAFEGSTIKTILKTDKRKTLLVCGFNLNACIYSTVVDARRNGFDVCLLRDLVGNDKYNFTANTPHMLKKMKEKGVVIRSSAEALTRIAALNCHPNTSAIS